MTPNIERARDHSFDASRRPWSEPSHGGSIERPPMPVALAESISLLASAQVRAAMQALEALSVDRDGDVCARLSGYFAAALRARAGITRGDDGNLYGGAAGPAVMLDAFRVLTEETPLVSFGHRTVSAAIDELATRVDSLHLVDLGIGLGAQWNDLFARLARHAHRPALRITGVDLPAPGEHPEAALRCTGERLASLAAQHGIAFSFEARAEPIEGIRSVSTRADEALVVNAALSLHHVPDEGEAGSARGATLARIASWRPARLFLVEPDAEHHALSFEARAIEAWRHYGLVFAALDATLDRSLGARSVIEGAFFGREIANVVGAEGAARFERHERIATWRSRLERAGFTASPITQFAPEIRGAFRARVVDDAAALCLGAHPLVAASAWRV